MEMQEVPRPTAPPGGVLVRTSHSVISIGTEKMKIQQAKMNLLQKARARPDQVRKVLDTARTLGWPRSDIAQAILGFTEPGIKSIDITDHSGAVLPVQIVSVLRGRDGGIRQARVAFLARNVPPLGYSIYHAMAQSDAPDPKKPGPPELLDDRGQA